MFFALLYLYLEFVNACHLIFLIHLLIRQLFLYLIWLMAVLYLNFELDFELDFIVGKIYLNDFSYSLLQVNFNHNHPF